MNLLYAHMTGPNQTNNLNLITVNTFNKNSIIYLVKNFIRLLFKCFIVPNTTFLRGTIFEDCYSLERIII